MARQWAIWRPRDLDSLADTLAEVETEKLGDTLGDVAATSIVVAPADTVAEVKAKTLGDILGDVRQRHSSSDCLAQWPRRRPRQFSSHWAT